MKRSEINKYIAEAIVFFRDHGFLLPPYAEFTREQWLTAGDAAEEIFDLQLGWDVTSFGSGDFFRMGLLLFTLRNGHITDPRYPKPYAEKIMMVRPGQVTPRHFHWNKREDIINRGGGNLLIELYKANPVENALDKDGGSFSIKVNSMLRTMNTGDTLILRPGDSVCLEPVHAHTFYADPELNLPVMAGEVSMVNDDHTDNCFVDGMPRFDPVEEDEEIRYYLGNDYGDLRK